LAGDEPTVCVDDELVLGVLVVPVPVVVDLELVVVEVVEVVVEVREPVVVVGKMEPWEVRMVLEDVPEPVVEDGPAVVENPKGEEGYPFALRARISRRSSLLTWPAGAGDAVERQCCLDVVGTTALIYARGKSYEKRIAGTDARSIGAARRDHKGSGS